MNRIYGCVRLRLTRLELIDSSIPGAPGATDISKTVSSDASLTFTDDTELANMVGPLSQVDENGDVKVPVTSTIASVGVEPAWNQSQVWSNNVSGSIDTNYGNALDAFNGDLSTKPITGGANMLVPAPNNTLTISFTGLPNVSKVGIWCAASDTIGTVRINGTNIASQLTAARTASGLGIDQSGWSYIDMPFGPTSFGSFSFYRSSDSSDGIYLSALAADGKTLVDTGIPGDPGADDVLTFNAPNPDLQYFQPGDNVGTSSGFAPVLYTGNGGTQSINCGFSPDLVWIKSRNATYYHNLYDTVRGAGKELQSNTTGAESTENNALTAFNPNGFALGNGAGVNNNTTDFVAWCWDAGDTTVTNNDGTIESQVRSNGNFSVVSYTGTGNAVSIGHGLSTAPKLLITKNRSRDVKWNVYHFDTGTNKSGFLNSSSEFSNSTLNGTTPPTALIFNTGGGNYENSYSGDEYVTYAWAETPGVSSFGSYTGNGTPGTGPIVDCGFKPAFVLLRNPNISENWLIFDSVRDESARQYLVANDPNPEGVGGGWITFLDNGFQLNSNSTAVNPSGQSVIYAAFAGGNPIEVVDVDVAANKMTVDGGDWGVYNQSQEWSSNLSASGSGFKSGNPATNAFDGTGSNAVTNDANATLTFAMSSYSLSGPVEVKYGTGNSGEYSTTFVGSTGTETQTFTLPALQSGIWRGTVDVGTITSISVTTTSGSQMNLIGVKVAGKLLIDTSITPPGETVVTGPQRIASANDVEYLDGNTLGVNGVSGTWFPGLHAQGAEVTSTAPSPESIQYTSANGTPLTTPFTGTDATLTTRTWTWQVSNAATGPWTDFATKVDVPGQDGAVPLADRPTLEENKFYQVKVRYDSNNAEFVESTFNTFKTGTN